MLKNVFLIDGANDRFDEKLLQRCMSEYGVTNVILEIVDRICNVDDPIGIQFECDDDLSYFVECLFAVIHEMTLLECSEGEEHTGIERLINTIKKDLASKRAAKLAAATDHNNQH